MVAKLRDRLKEPYYVHLEDSLNARIESGELTEETALSWDLDSLVLVQLTMDLEELGIDPTAPIKTVGDLLRLLRTIGFQRRCK
jgi:hypothetical protein